MSRRLRLTQEVVDYVMGDAYQGTEISLFNLGNIEEHLNEEFLIQDLLIGIGMASASDCTYMIVRDISGSEEAFVDLMNQKVAELGLQNTHFSNAIGIENESNYTTAEDMAVIMAYAMQSELIADILKPRDQVYTIKAHYIDEFGDEQTYNVHFESSFLSRKEKYKNFQLTTTRLDATKTGYTNESFIVCMATSKQTGKKYILVLGNQKSDHTTISEKFKATMMDIEFLYNEYVK